MQDLRYDQSGAEATAKRAGMAKHRLKRESDRRQDAAMAFPTRHGRAGRRRQQQDGAHQQPLPELGLQGDHRQRFQGRGDIVGAADDHGLDQPARRADDQRARRAAARETQQVPPQARGVGLIIPGGLRHRGARHQREEHQRAEQRHQRGDVRAAQRRDDDFQSAHALLAHCHSGCFPPCIGMAPMPPITAPAFATVAVAVTGPAFAKLSVIGKLSPSFRGRFSPDSMM